MRVINALNVFLFLTSEILRTGSRWSSRSFGAFVFLVIVSTSARAQVTGPPEEPSEEIRAGNIVAVQFEGNHALSSDELATVTETKVTSPFSRLLYGIPLIKSFGA